MKVLFINDSTTDSNWGGRAATLSLRMMIEEAGGSIFRTITIEDLLLSSFGSEDTAKVAAWPKPRRSRELAKPFIPPILLSARRRLLARKTGIPEPPPIPRTWHEYHRCLDVILGTDTPWPDLLQSFQSLDVAVVFGDGDIYGNGVLPRSLLFLSYVIRKHFGKPVIMVNHSADFDHEDLLRAAREVYPLFDDVVFREPMSAQRCASLCSGRVAADTCFLFEPAPRAAWAAIARRPTYFDVWPDTARFDPSGPYLCLGGSSIIDTTDDLESTTRQYSVLVDRLRSVYGGQIVLTASDLVDQPVFRSLAQQENLPLIGVTTPVQQAVDIAGNADAYIGGRFHPSVFALRGGAPVIPLSSKTFKMEALVEMAGLACPEFDALDLARHADAICSLLLSYLDQGHVLRNRIRTWADEMAEDSRDNVAFLHQWAAHVAPCPEAGT